MYLLNLFITFWGAWLYNPGIKACLFYTPSQPGAPACCLNIVFVHMRVLKEKAFKTGSCHVPIETALRLSFLFFFFYFLASWLWLELH